MAKRLPQLYYIKMKIFYDLGFIAIGVAMATSRSHYVFYLSFCFSVTGVFFKNRSREFVPNIIASGLLFTDISAHLPIFTILFDHCKNTI